MFKVQTKKKRGVANITTNILLIHYFIQLFFQSGKGICTHTLCVTLINISIASMSQHEQPDLVKDSFAHGRGIVLGDL